MIGSFITISKRVFFFLAVNFVIIITLSFVLSMGMQYFGIKLEGFNFLLILYSIIGMGGALFSLWSSKWQAIKFMGVRIVSEQENNSDIRTMVQRVHHLARKAGLPKMPEVGVYDNQEVNAFATGPSKKNSLVAVSTGLLKHMNETEVEGVLAHEISHIANGDMVTMTLIQGVVNVLVYLIAHLIASIVSSAMSRGRSNFFLHWMLRSLFVSLLYIPASMIVCFFSRWREYRADHGGASLAGRAKMIAALQSLAQISQHGVPQQEKQKSQYNYLKINSTKQQVSWWIRLFATHPPIQSRIKRLQRTII